jgi:tetratricopeptide (TPR) repeat protein
MLARRTAVLLLLSAGACGTTHTLTLPDRLEGLPSSLDPDDRAVDEARRRFEGDDARGALREVENVLGHSPAHVDARRLRQDILRERGRIALLRSEAEQALAQRPDDPVAHYLAGRIAPTPERRFAWFERVTQLSPRLVWGWLGVAFTLREGNIETALTVYGQLFRQSEEHPLVSIAFASTLVGARRFEDAIRVYQSLQKRQTTPGVAELGLARTWFARGNQTAGWPFLLIALRTIPHDPGVRELVQQALQRGLSDDQVDQVLDTLRSAPHRMQQFTQGAGAGVAATLMLRSGEALAARALLEREGKGPQAPVVRRLWRRTLLQTGDVAGYLRDLADSFPRILLADERNRLRGDWHVLLHGPWREHADPLGDPAVTLSLATALRMVGLLEESDTVMTLALLRHHGRVPAGLVELRNEVQRELAFERSLRRIVYSGYARPERTLEDVLEDLRRVSKDLLGKDVVGAPRTFSIPFVGEMVDPFSDGIGAHLASFNRHLVLGKRSGQPVEALLLTRLSLRDVEPEALLPLPARCSEVVGEDREIRALSTVYGGDLAGVALFNHYVIDMDSVRDWAHSLLEKRRIAREDGGALLHDPLPADCEPLESLDAQWRLALLSPEEDSVLVEAVLDMIRWHELGHLIDSFHFLPPEQNLWRVLGLLFRHGFSGASIEAELEARAEVVPLALSRHTQLVLAHVAGFLDGSPGSSPHAHGFRRLAERIQEAAQARGLDAASPRHWHRLDPAVAQAIGRELLRRQW